MRYDTHCFYGKMHKGFYGLPGIVQHFGIRRLLFYGALPDAFSLLSWHLMICFG
jgi:hypothetical protein